MPGVYQLHRDLLKFLRSSELGFTERDLIERAVIEALRNGSGCDIEQVVSLPDDRMRRRLRVQVSFHHGSHGELEAHLSLQQDGECVADWTWPDADGGSMVEDGRASETDQDTAMIDSVTAIMFYSAAIDRLARNNALEADIFECCAGISGSARRILGLSTIGSM